MTIATSPTSLHSPAAFTKMEDRKRPASTAVDDTAPPSKRQAVNGNSKTKDDGDSNKEDAWVEQYQKGAIYRQMQEYKREKSKLEVRIQEIQQKSIHHDDHVRVIDAWLLQLLQEIELLAETKVSAAPNTSDIIYKSALAFKDQSDFERHLADKSKAIKARTGALFQRLEAARGQVKPEVAELEHQIKTLLANQKQLVVKVDRLESENASLSEQLDTQTLKALKAERKLDRAKSTQVQNLEQQAMGNATSKSTNDENGTPTSSEGADGDELRHQYQEIAAVLAKTKEQLQAMSAEVKALQEENSAFKIKRENFTDEDYARTEVFKKFKGQNEELIKRINHLQATNKELREEAEKLRAERAAYKVQLESEAQAVTLELEEQIQLKDQDLTRIRSARDELTAELAMRKAIESQERTAAIHMKELSDAKDDRIAELESELERLRPKEDADMPDARADLEALSVDDLRQKYIKLEKDFEAINKEVPLLEKSYKKAMALAQKKVMDFHALEERVAVLTAEKSKADQKYFAARKDTDIRIAENRALRAQNGKSSEIISTLKDLDQQSKGLLGTLEKQLMDLKQSNSAVMAENKKLEQLSTEATRRAEALKAQMTEMHNVIKSKDSSVSTFKEKTMDCETEVEKLKVKAKNAAKDAEKWKAKAHGKSTMEEEQLRSMVICSICVINFKNTILRGCGHSFCNGCVEDRLTNRMRKCPSCNKAFDRTDVTPFHM